MSLFTAVVGGQSMKASDFNQYANVFNGATVGEVLVTQTNVGTPTWLLTLPSGVASGTSWFTLGVSGDAYPRVSLYLTSAGNLGVRFGFGNATYTGRLEATSSGWNALDQVTVNGPVAVGGNLTSTSLSTSGNLTVTGGTQVGSGAGSGGQITGTAAQISNGGANPVLYTYNGTSITVYDDGTYIGFTPTRSGSGGARDLCVMGDSASGGTQPTLDFRQDGWVYLGSTAYMQTGTFNGMNGAYTSIGGTSATISHGLGKTPSHAIASTGYTGSNAIWTDCGCGNYGSSTYTIWLGAAGYSVYSVAFAN